MPNILYKVTLTQEERTELEEITTRGNHNSQKVLNALILLGVDEGEFNKEKKKQQLVSLRNYRSAQGKWRGLRKGLLSAALM